MTTPTHCRLREGTGKPARPGAASHYVAGMPAFVRTACRFNAAGKTTGSNDRVVQVKAGVFWIGMRIIRPMADQRPCAQHQPIKTRQPNDGKHRCHFQR